MKHGTNAYRAVHYWIAKQMGKPQECENCGCTDGDVAYEWANLSGEYLRDISDWARLCKRCHNLIDNPYTRKEFCKNGHEHTQANTRISTASNGGVVYQIRVCMDCARERMRQYRLKRVAT